ncbi:MAG: hypothetical protein H0W62_13765 [Chitinophagales bacterium]|nr:hypothetical protein [Chitinophagales bacterium]
MLDLPILNVAIAMVFIFFLLSILTSGIVEIVTSIFQKRGKDLRWAIDEVFNDPRNKNWTELMYEHPLIDGLKRTDDHLPSYISSDVFTKALIDVMIFEGKQIKITSNPDGNIVYTEIYPSDNVAGEITFKDNHERTFYNFKKGVQTLGSSDVKAFLNNFIYKSKDFLELKDHLEDWYNEYMDRATGWYKRDLRKWLFFFGLLIAIVLNVDTIYITGVIYRNKDLRTALNYQAQQVINSGGLKINQDTLAGDSTGTLRDSAIYFSDMKRKMDSIAFVYNEIKELNLPIGWKIDSAYFPHDTLSVKDTTVALKIKTYWQQFRGCYSGIKKNIKMNADKLGLLTFLGWIFTAIAVSLGAPFWFDTMKKFVNMRSTGNKTET